MNAIYFVLDTFLRKMIGTLELTSAVLRCLLDCLLFCEVLDTSRQKGRDTRTDISGFDVFIIGFYLI